MPRPEAQPCSDCGRARSGRAPGVLLCRCHEKRRAAEKLAANRSAQLATVARLIVELDQTVTPDQVEDLLAQVAPAAHAHTLLLGHLANHPAVLTSGGSSMPKLVGEFLYAAIDAGIAGLAAPSCALCRRPRPLFHTHDDGQRICTTCYSRLRVATCSGCGRENQRIKVRTSDGSPLCPRCHDHARQPEACAGCGQLRLLKRSTADSLDYCRGCQSRRSPTEPCSVCGQDRRVNARAADGSAVCSTCYAKSRTSTDVCHECGAVGPLNARAGGRTATGKDVCIRCYRHPKRECGICGRARRVALKATDTSTDVCPTCYQAPMIDCSVCGQHALGRRTTKEGQPWCFACQATERIDQLLAAADRSIPDGLKDVRDVLVAGPRPRSILSNWNRIGSLSLLAKLAREHTDLTHELLDAEGNRFSVNYLRAVLVATGALPARDENLARLHRFAARVIAEVSYAQDRQNLSRYARWTRS